MADLAYTFYDTAQFSAAAAGILTLFQTAQGSSATRTKSQTNWPGAGSLPSENRFQVRKIGVMVNDPRVEADIPLIYEQTYAEVFLNSQSVFVAPLKLLADHDTYQGVLGQTAAGDFAGFGAVGDGYPLSPIIDIPGGQSFRVEIYQANALSIATDLVFMMHGLWTKPN